MVLRCTPHLLATTDNGSCLTSNSLSAVALAFGRLGLVEYPDIIRHLLGKAKASFTFRSQARIIGHSRPPFVIIGSNYSLGQPAFYVAKVVDEYAIFVFGFCLC